MKLIKSMSQLFLNIASVSNEFVKTTFNLICYEAQSDVSGQSQLMSDDDFLDLLPVNAHFH